MVEVTNGGEKVPQRWRGGEAGWTADSGGGERPGSSSRQGAAAGGEERSGVVRSYEITPTPIPF